MESIEGQVEALTHAKRFQVFSLPFLSPGFDR
jgi:hypothetical protein